MTCSNGSGTRTVALIGESGAGKSTLVNALVEGDVAAEGDVREGDSKGRHTTTHRELHLLDGGGILVDTPGIREVGIWTDTDAVAESFPDIEELAEQLPVPRLRPRDRARLRGAGRGRRPARCRQSGWPRGVRSTPRRRRPRCGADAVEYRRRNRQFGRIAREAQQLKDEQRNRP